MSAQPPWVDSRAKEDVSQHLLRKPEDVEASYDESHQPNNSWWSNLYILSWHANAFQFRDIDFWRWDSSKTGWLGPSDWKDHLDIISQKKWLGPTSQVVRTQECHSFMIHHSISFKCFWEYSQGLPYPTSWQYFGSYGKSDLSLYWLKIISKRCPSPLIPWLSNEWLLPVLYTEAQLPGTFLPVRGRAWLIQSWVLWLDSRKCLVQCTWQLEIKNGVAHWAYWQLLYITIITILLNHN